MPSNYYLSQVIRYNSTIGVPLDTVSILLSRYNNSVSTSKTTVYGGFAALSGTTFRRAIAVQEEIRDQLYNAANLADYDDFGAYVHAETTNETSVGILSEPTPYMAIAGIALWTSISGPGDKSSNLLTEFM